ncbi:DUF2752 domain-containing protein [Leptotrichia sp. OH3620_COT-345]|nr:DUF2752 domain-containing protein [Leptotrichia sp. OH3620_COT-345]
MKKYLLLLYNYHKGNIFLYISLPIVIYIFYYFKLPTPLSLILKPFGINYWSIGLTRASIQLISLNLKKAYEYNPLIYSVFIIGISHLLVFPLFNPKN